MQQGNDIALLCLFQLLNTVTNFDELRYERYAIEEFPTEIFHFPTTDNNDVVDKTSCSFRINVFFHATPNFRVSHGVCNVHIFSGLRDCKTCLSPLPV